MSPMLMRRRKVARVGVRGGGGGEGTGSYQTYSLFLYFSSSLSPYLRHSHPPPFISLLLWLSLIGLDKLGFLGSGHYGFGATTYRASELFGSDCEVDLVLDV
ncbi:hypothetical protein PRUPE_1G517900 [Prunus persica]|uniref:Uncharacterized protein n=1 Tax=Prunus persica TaxID=3760 RepID=A0A251RGE3_PRUPE|nr:hypothetical protein PRUPE_1G517900 [Prunus persica]